MRFKSIAQLQKLLANRDISYAEMYQESYAQYRAHDSTINSVIEWFADQEKTAGILGLVKDNICQKNRITSCASQALKNYRAPYNATAVERLAQAGLISVGRANCDEFAMGSGNESSIYGPVRNPWDSTRVSGGSSGGSIAAVAAGYVPWALGSETGGSVRLPAAYCGIVGMKPTYGRVSRYGLVAYTSSFDQIGVATRTVWDNAYVLSKIAGKDVHDSTTLSSPVPDYTGALTGKLKPGLRIGVLDTMLNADGVSPAVQSAIQESLCLYEKLGAHITRVSIPALEYTAAVYFILSRAEAASNLARFDGIRYGHADLSAPNLFERYVQDRLQGFGLEVKSRILIGTHVLSVGYADQYYNSAQKARIIMRDELDKAFKSVDILLSPTAPDGAFKIGEFALNSLQADLMDYFTSVANITGCPAISIPCGFTPHKLPIGLQLMARHEHEELLYQTAHAYEQNSSWGTEHPF